VRLAGSSKGFLNQDDAVECSSIIARRRVDGCSCLSGPWVYGGVHCDLAINGGGIGEPRMGGSSDEHESMALIWSWSLGSIPYTYHVVSVR
jgi:hypothetical protein